MTLGLCSQIDLDFEVSRANKDRPQQPDQGAMLMPAEITTGPRSFEPEAVPSRENVFAKSEPAARDDEEDDVDVNSVFAKLKSLKQPE